MLLARLRPNRAFHLPRFLAARYMSIYGDDCPLVLSPRQLRDIHLSDPSKLSILDASWHMPNSPRKANKEFLEKHIPGARYLDLDQVASPHELGLMHMMPSGKVFADACDALGIKLSSHVVIYDTHGIFSSPRALFMFRSFGHHRSSILDGGLPAWIAHDCPVEAGEPAAASSPATTYPPPFLDEAVIRSYEQIVANTKFDVHHEPHAEVVIDARSQGRFVGEDPEPRPNLPSGHIPRSYSVPFTSFLGTNTIKSSDPDAGGLPVTYTSLKPNVAIIEALRSSLGDKLTKDVLSGERAVTTSCGSGMTAGVVWLGLKLLGVDTVGFYDESWTGYALRKESDIAKGK